MTINPVIKVPELNGKPTELTKNTSKFPNNFRVDGNNNLKMNSRIAAEITLAKMKFLSVISL
jgi:hypothetical protein